MTYREKLENLWNDDAAAPRQPLVEALESRQMLSVTATSTVDPNSTVVPLAARAAIEGYTPAQIRKAYGFDQIKGDGTGQTIAIVDAFDNPNIAADLKAFNAAFGLKDSPLIKINQNGGSTRSVKADPGWASEIALDVEWAHAMAPGATILLVEANSDRFGDLMTAVNTARNYPGVSVVSMSFGASEFFGQAAYDKFFTTPAGHQGVTFVASAGDDGSSWGPEWPSSSANVLAVGGTTLNLTSTGAYAGETGWSGGGGGVSRIVSEPSYQTAVQSTGRRSAPDVSYDANPNTGFAVYDSYGSGGWTVVGGTSAGAPQWAAMIALANQARVAAGKGTLDGATGTLPALYQLYNGAGTYAANFNDVTVGRTSFATSARAGYDAVSGLGTPKAAAVVASLAGNASSTAATTTTATRGKSGKTKAARKAKAAAVVVAQDADAAQAASTAAVIDETRRSAPALMAGNPVNAPAVFDALVHASSVAPLSSVYPLTLNAASPSAAHRIADVPLTTAPASAAAPIVSSPLGRAPAPIVTFSSASPSTLINDPLAWLTRDTLALGESVGAAIVADSAPSPRPWLTTAAVLIADAILIGRYVRRGSQKKRHAPASPFSLIRVTPRAQD